MEVSSFRHVFPWLGAAEPCATPGVGGSWLGLWNGIGMMEVHGVLDEWRWSFVDGFGFFDELEHEEEEHAVISHGPGNLELRRPLISKCNYELIS